MVDAPKAPQPGELAPGEPQQIEVQPVHAGGDAELRELQSVLEAAEIRSVVVPPPGSQPGKG